MYLHPPVPGISSLNTILHAQHKSHFLCQVGLFCPRLSLSQGHSSPALVSPCVTFLETRKVKYLPSKAGSITALKIALKHWQRWDDQEEEVFGWNCQKIILYRMFQKREIFPIWPYSRVPNNSLGHKIKPTFTFLGDICRIFLSLSAFCYPHLGHFTACQYLSKEWEEQLTSVVKLNQSFEIFGNDKPKLGIRGKFH